MEMDVFETLEKELGTRNFFLERGVIDGERDLEEFLKTEEGERKEKFFILIGRGPGGRTHLGHYQFWTLARDLQKVFGLSIIFHITDDEKFLENSNEENFEENYEETLKDLETIDFDFKNFEVLIGSKMTSHRYHRILEISRKISIGTIGTIFGKEIFNSIGRCFFPATQIAPVFLRSKRAIVICGRDQDPFFLLARDVAKKLKRYKPIMIYKKMFPSVDGKDRMRSRVPRTSIYLDDSREDIKKKVRKMFSGGRRTLSEHMKKGANLEICSVYRMLNEFLIGDSRKMEEIRRRYSEGSMSVDQIKEILHLELSEFLKRFHEKRGGYDRKIRFLEDRTWS